MRYRISFVVTHLGDVLPLQQCVDTTFEESYVVETGYWLLEPPELMKMTEITPVSEQLDQMIGEVTRYREKPMKLDDDVRARCSERTAKEIGPAGDGSAVSVLGFREDMQSKFRRGCHRGAPQRLGKSTWSE